MRIENWNAKPKDDSEAKKCHILRNKLENTRITNCELRMDRNPIAVVWQCRYNAFAVHRLGWISSNGEGRQ